MPPISPYGVVLLGVADRARLVIEPASHVPAWNILGLKQFVPSYIFPADLSSLKLIFAIHDPAMHHGRRFEVRGPDGEYIGWGVFTFRRPGDGTSDDRAEPLPVHDMAAFAIYPEEARVATAVFSMAPLQLYFPTPGYYEFTIQEDTHPVSVGGIRLVEIAAPPLTPDRVAAMKADPRSPQSVHVEFTCNTCGESLIAYAALERSAELESLGYIWYEKCPEVLECRCGRRVNISTVRKNLHGLLGFRAASDLMSAAFIPRYERSAIETLRINFLWLLNSDAPEEVFQQFIEANLLVFHSFSPARIFFKSPILNTFRTDFVIINHARELLLIEIEKPSTRLLTKMGGISAELQHALDQVRNWIHAIDEHRLAALDAIGVRREEVATVLGVVVAGRDSPYEPDRLRWLKSIDHGRVRILTYDDIHASIESLVKGLDSL